MSSVLKKLNILFCIIFVQLWKIISPASVYYSDYNSRDIFDIDASDYFDYNLPKTRIIEQNQYLNDAANNNEVICTTAGGAKADTAATHATTCFPVTPPSKAKKPATTCFPVTAPPKGKQPTTTRPPVTPPPKPKEPSTTCFPVTPPSKAKADNIVEHILSTIKSMRAHATALITDMDILEKDLSGSSPSDLDAIKNSSAFAGTKIVYPDVLYQSPGYIINEWSVPVLKDAPQTNQFVEQAQEAVKSWKLQIENCKRILDNAVHNALQKANIKSDIKDPLAKSTAKDDSSKLPAKKKENQKKNKKDLKELLAVREKHKQYGLYDALDTKFDDY